MAECKIESISPSICLKKEADGLKQMIRLGVLSSARFSGAQLAAKCGGKLIGRQSYDLLEGENQLEFFIEELPKRRKVSFELLFLGEAIIREIEISPPRRWVVHVVQRSHHDLGYTDLASNVQKEQAQNLAEAIIYAEQTASYPADAKFRIVIEQTWSLGSFFKNAGRQQQTKMIALLQNGRFEMTALCGNMTSELCGHETLIRTAYQSARFARLHNIPAITAEHNDVPGISWGLSEVLANIGVKLFCPGLPLYYGWGESKFRSFWNAGEIFGYDNAPGAFWWETPSKKRVLLWCENNGGAYDNSGKLPRLEAHLENMAANGYPYPVARYPVGGGDRDNSPYIRAYADTILKWNEKWAYPRLICSTNAKFYRDFAKITPCGLPVWRGELPGQDYPSGATSTAIALAANRRNHEALTNAEKLASAASLHTGYVYQNDRIREAYEESMLHDEHTWGYQFPAGAAARASEYEKALRAFRAEAFAAEVRDKSMAHIADSLKLKAGEIYLVVFNQSSWPISAPVSAPMREMDGTGSVMRDTGETLKGALLGCRWHVYPDKSYIDEGFDLIDETTGERVAYELTELGDAFEPSDFAPQRVGLGRGTKRFGAFEHPAILRYNICFVARDIPAYGYKAYRLRKNRIFSFAVPRNPADAENAIENEYYRIAADPKTMRIASIYDKETKRELVDFDGGDFYALIVRDKNSPEQIHETKLSLAARQKNICSKICIEASAPGHPVIRRQICLYPKVKNVYFETSVFKDPSPLQNAHLAFPLKADNPEFRYESALSIMEPVKDYLPGAYSDVVAVQNWVRIQDGDSYMLWNSPDAPMAGFGKLWQGYVSPAHRCFVDENFRHDPQTERDYQKNGWIFSQLFNNNFGTNFSVSQTGLAVFRHCLTSGRGKMGDPEAVRWGQQTSMPQSTIFTDRAGGNGALPPTGNFLESDNPEMPVLNWKAAEDGRGYIVRLWNVSDKPQVAELKFTGCAVSSANLADMAEFDLPGGDGENPGSYAKAENSYAVIKAEARAVATVRVHLG